MKTLPAEMKRCDLCEVLKCISEFNFNRDRTDGLQDWCRDCLKKPVRGIDDYFVYKDTSRGDVVGYGVSNDLDVLSARHISRVSPKSYPCTLSQAKIHRNVILKEVKEYLESTGIRVTRI